MSVKDAGERQARMISIGALGAGYGATIKAVGAQSSKSLRKPFRELNKNMADDYLECYREIYRKARKQHSCYECRGKIVRGENYWYVSGIGEDGPFDAKICLCCYKLQKDLIKKCNSFYDAPGFGELHNDIGDTDDKELINRWNDNCRLRESKDII
jgi:hypothetical protein